MSQLRRELGFWAAVARLTFRQFAQPEFLGALVVGVGGGLVFIQHSNVFGRINLAGDSLVLIGGLLGIVFAGFSLVVSLMSDDHLRWLNSGRSGIVPFLSPFMLAIGLQVGVLLGAIIYRASATNLTSGAEKSFFVVLSFLFVYAVLDIVALARNIFAHGVTRARAQQVEDLADARERRMKKETSGDS